MSRGVGAGLVINRRKLIDAMAEDIDSDTGDTDDEAHERGQEGKGTGRGAGSGKGMSGPAARESSGDAAAIQNAGGAVSEYDTDDVEIDEF